MVNKRPLTQRIWDIRLFRAFYETPNMKLLTLIGFLKRDYEFEYEYIRKLKRTIKPHNGKKITISVFICNYLPKAVSNYLWSHDVTDVLDFVSTLTDDIDTLSKRIDYKGHKDITNELRRSKRLSDKLKLEINGYCDFKDRVNGSLNPSQKIGKLKTK